MALRVAASRFATSIRPQAPVFARRTGAVRTMGSDPADLPTEGWEGAVRAKFPKDYQVCPPLPLCATCKLLPARRSNPSRIERRYVFTLAVFGDSPPRRIPTCAFSSPSPSPSLQIVILILGSYAGLIGLNKLLSSSEEEAAPASTGGGGGGGDSIPSFQDEKWDEWSKQGDNLARWEASLDKDE